MRDAQSQKLNQGRRIGGLARAFLSDPIEGLLNVQAKVAEQNREEVERAVDGVNETLRFALAHTQNPRWITG
jgi:hypothetical protein